MYHNGQNVATNSATRGGGGVQLQALDGRFVSETTIIILIPVLIDEKHIYLNKVVQIIIIIKSSLLLSSIITVKQDNNKY